MKCKENFLNAEWESQETDFTVKSCCGAHFYKVQGQILTKTCDCDKLENKQCSPHMAVTDQGGLARNNCGCHFPSVTQQNKSIGVQECSYRMWCSNRKCLESLKEDSNPCLFSSGRKHLPDHCGCDKDK